MDETGDILGNSVAVSVSGGGHRATLFALGALMYLVDAGVNTHVTSIASVSGGSLTNGLIGQELNYRQTDGKEFRARVASPLATLIAKRGTLFAPLLSKIYVTVLVLWGLAALIVPWTIDAPWYGKVILFFISITLLGWFVALRGRLCAYAFRVTLFSPNKQTTKLSQVQKLDLDHVICSTEMCSAQQVYFGGDFIYSYALGLGVPAELSLAAAVQASAAFPGGFPPPSLPTAQHNFQGTPPESKGGPPSFPAQMVLTDGGVYDNMGEQWARGFAKRMEACSKLASGRTEPDQLIVVNASARVPWTPFKRRFFPWLGEFLALLRINDILYINTTNVRRQAIVDSYNPAEPTTASAMPSALVQISQSPFVVPNAYAESKKPVGDRARAALQFLQAGPTSKVWSEIAKDNADVGTSLSKFGTDVSVRLIYHAYVVTMCNLHVLFGNGFPLIPQGLSEDRFRELIV
jgi:hypothetical protein